MIRKSLLYKSNVEYADFCLNYVDGCSHGCRYPCYAMLMAKRFGKISSYEDWTKPKIVTNALDILEKEIPRLKDKIKFVHFCFMTDPFMYGNTEVRKLTLKIIEKLNNADIKCTALSKGILPKQLSDFSKFSPENEYGITLVSLDPDFKRKYEPGAAPYLKRINALKHLHECGLKTWVSVEPYPTPNLDATQDLNKLLDTMSFVDKIIFGRMNYSKEVSSFKSHADFYDAAAKKVISYCIKNGKEYHIKNGTQKRYNQKTETIFEIKHKSKNDREISPCLPSVPAIACQTQIF